MPRGVYDRSKKKDSAAVAAPKAPKAAKVTKALKGQLDLPVLAKVSEDVQATDSVGYKSYNPAPHDLYTHLTTLTQARLTVNSQQSAHNETLLSAIDSELIETTKALRVWRESRYPAEVKVAKVVEPAKVEVKETPVAAAPALPAFPQPISAPVAAIPAPPLPFTPQAVQEVMKHQA